MLKYMQRVGETLFSRLPFTEVDNLIFSQLSYCGYEKVRLPLPLRAINGHVSYGVMQKNKELFSLAATLPRYSETLALCFAREFSKEETLQFAAVTFLLPDGTAYVSFRGTDSTLVGWREDFMLSYATPVSAQLCAVEYLNRVGALLDCPLRVGGHSKGGNLAVFASAFCSQSVRKNIVEIYTNDGPGFELQVIESEQYKAIRPLIKRYVPEGSIIGMLMEQDSSYTVVDSSSVSLWQHNPYSWKTEGCGFVRKDRTSLMGDVMSESLRGWFRAMSPEKRRFLTETVFDALQRDGAQTFDDVFKSPEALASIAAAVKNLSPEDKAGLANLGELFTKSLARGAVNAIKDRLTEDAEGIRYRLEEKFNGN